MFGDPLEPFLFLATAAVLGLSGGLAPGPLTTLVFTQTLRYGPREGVKVAMAPLITDGFFVLLAAFAVERLMEEYRGNSLWLTFSGGSVFFGLVSLRDTWQVSGISVAADERTTRYVAEEYWCRLLNPHPYLFWFTVGGPLVVQAWLDWMDEFDGLFGWIFMFVWWEPKWPWPC